MTPRFGILHKGEMHQVIAFGELIVAVAVAVVHQAPAAANEGEDAGTLHIILCGLAETIVQRPCFWLMQIAEGVLADTLVTAIGLGFKEEMIKAVLVLYNIRIDGRSVKVEQYLRLAFQSAEISIGITPLDAVIGDGTIVCQQREVNHILACSLIVNGLRCPDTGYVGKVGSAEALGEVYGVMLPVNHVAGTHEHHTSVAGPPKR